MLLIATTTASEFSLRFNLNNGVAVDPVVDFVGSRKQSELPIGFQTPDGAVLKYYNFKHGWLVEVVVRGKCYNRKCLSGVGAHRLFQDVAARSMHLMAANGRMVSDHGAQLVDLFGFQAVT